MLMQILAWFGVFTVSFGVALLVTAVVETKCELHDMELKIEKLENLLDKENQNDEIS